MIRYVWRRTGHVSQTPWFIHLWAQRPKTGRWVPLHLWGVALFTFINLTFITVLHYYEGQQSHKNCFNMLNSKDDANWANAIWWRRFIKYDSGSSSGNLGWGVTFIEAWLSKKQKSTSCSCCWGHTTTANATTTTSNRKENSNTTRFGKWQLLRCTQMSCRWQRWIEVSM